MNKFRYEDSDKKILVDIYGIEFSVNDISKSDIEEIKDNQENEEILDKFLIKMLGENAIEKINEQRKKDGYEEMDLKIKAGLLAFVFQTYCNELYNNVENMYKSVNNSVDNFRNYNNRQERRYNKRNHRRY